MNPTQVKPIPDGFHTANVYLIVPNAAKQIAFLDQAFGAKELHRSTMPDGSIIHAKVKIGDSTVMLGQSNDMSKARPATVYIYVDDVDAVHKRSVEAGAKSLQQPSNQFYGDRSGGIEDPNGNWWWVATHFEDVSDEESDRRFAAMGHKH